MAQRPDAKHKRNPNDATFRNIDALKKEIRRIKARLTEVEKRVTPSPHVLNPHAQTNSWTMPQPDPRTVTVYAGLPGHPTIRHQVGD